jgi:hypothetical protein
MGNHIILQITQEEVEAHPNNYSLGEYVRSKYHQTQKEEGRHSNDYPFGRHSNDYPNDGNPEESDEVYTLD